MNVIKLVPARDPRDYASIQSKVECYQKPTREWRDHLTVNEQVVLMQIIDRTIGWGRREAYFTAMSIINGDEVYSGLQMSRATLFRALASLESRGFIRRRRDRVVPNRMHYTVNMNWKPDVADIPKRLQGWSHSETTPSHGETTPSHSETLYTGINLQVSNTGSQAGSTAPLPSTSAEKVREAASGAAATHRARLAGKAQGPQAAVDAVDAAWRLALIDTFPGTAYRTWGVREKAQVKVVLRNWRGDCTLPEFVTWAVTNWTAIVRKQFKWMTKTPPPTAPALSFFIAFIDKFSDARAEGVLEDWLSAEDRTQIERMMGRGQTYEQATAELGRQKATVALREEMSKREIAVRARDYGATRKLAEAKKIAELKGGIPMHPNSPNARRLVEEERRRARPTPTRVVDPEGQPLQGAEVYFVDPDMNPFD